MAATINIDENACLKNNHITVLNDMVGFVANTSWTFVLKVYEIV